MPTLIASKLGNDSLLADKTFLSVVLGILLIIYCYQKDVSGIKAAAYWGVFGINLLLYLVMHDLMTTSKNDVLHDWNKLRVMGLDENVNNIISCISCIILSFSFHTYTFSIYECLTEKNTKSMLITTSVGLFVSMMIYLLFGCVGYILYVNQVDEYYIITRQQNTVLIYMENIAFVINVIMSFPLTFFSLRHYFTFLVQILITLLVEKFKCCKKNNENNPEDLPTIHESNFNEKQENQVNIKEEFYKRKSALDSDTNEQIFEQKKSLVELSLKSKFYFINNSLSLVMLLLFV